MEKGPKLFPHKEKLKLHKFNMRKCFMVEVVPIFMMIIVCGSSICAIYLSVQITSGASARALDTIVDKKKVVKENVAVGIMLFLGFSTMVIFSIAYFFAARELFATSSTPDVNKTLEIYGLCKTGCLVLILVSFFGVLVGYPDIQTCVCFISFNGLLMIVFLSIVLFESASKIQIYKREAKQLVDEKAQKSEMCVNKELEIV